MDIDHWMTDEVVCPHCGARYTDSWDLFSDGSETVEGVECDDCGKEFNAEVNMSVTYTTRKPTATTKGGEDE